MTKLGTSTEVDAAGSGLLRGILVAGTVALSFLLGLCIGVFLHVGSSPGAAGVEAGAPGQSRRIRVEAYIDGRSRLIVQGNTIQWHQFEWNRPGQLGNELLPTSINDVQWFPEWPDPDGTEKSDAKNYSGKFGALQPPLPATPVHVEVKRITGRGKIFVVQQPAANNQYTLIVEFNDNSFKGAAYYIVDLSY